MPDTTRVPDTDEATVDVMLQHIHRWDICRDYGQYTYRRCLIEECTAKQPC
jgi:hypothetical protein